MVEASEKYWSKRASLRFNNQSVDATLAVSEGGRPIVQLDDEIPQDSEPDNMHEVIKGTSIDGAEVTLKYVNAKTGFDSDSGHKIRSIKSVQEIEIDGIGGDAFVNEEVVINFDVLCFMPFYPIVKNQGEIPIIDRNQWGVEGEFANQIEEREEYIKSRRHALRTASITLTQKDQNGPPGVQIEKARSRVNNILDIASFLLGVGCSTSRIEVKKEEDAYTKILSTHRNIGSAFTGNKLVFGDLAELIDTAYDWYADETGNDYKLDQIIGYYLDSINVTRSVEGQLSTLFNGIELLAKRYSDYGPQFGSTPKRLEYLVGQLDVSVDDLARNSDVFPNRYIDDNHDRNWGGEILIFLLSLMRRSSYLSVPADLLERHLIREDPVPEYFYSKTRQYIVHGDNQSTFSGRYDLLMSDLESCKVFIQRLIRNQLFGNLDPEDHPRLGNLEPNEFTTFDS